MITLAKLNVQIPLASFEFTAVHSNGHGVFAYNAGTCKVIIHLPSHHNTIYNNERYDRRAVNGATITNVEDEEEDN